MRVTTLARDVVAWIDALGVERAHLVGHDWGAAIAYAAATLAPHRIDRVVTLAVPHLAGLGRGLRRHPGQLWRSRYMVGMLGGRLNDARLAADDLAGLETLWRRWSPGWTPPPDVLAAMKDALRPPDVLHAATDLYRSMIRPGCGASWRLLRGVVRAPTLALTGAQDGCIDTRLFDHMDPACFPAGLEVARLDGVGHFLHLEDPDRVNARVLAWLTPPG